MKRVRYTKYIGDLASEIEMDDLLKALSDYLLDSGFQDPYSRFSELNGDHTLENLREAIRQALESGELLDEDAQQRLQQMSAEQVDELIDRMIERMQQEEYVSIDAPHDPSQAATRPGNTGRAETEARFEVTDKGMDFLGYKALRELLGPLGKSNFGRHDTRHEAAGVEKLLETVMAYGPIFGIERGIDVEIAVGGEEVGKTDGA